VLTNEFYELESEKFSTSKGHVLSVQQILSEVPRDLVRTYLALTAPEFQRTTFSRAGLTKMVDERLVGPWNKLAETLGKVVANADGGPLPVTAVGRARAATMLERFDFIYEMPNYSMNRAADAILTQIGRLGRIAASLDGSDVEAFGDLFLQVNALLSVSSPILIDLAAAARAAGAYDGVLAPGAFAVDEVTAFAPPLLPVTTGGR
jgi:methionyl-tRNA synthetase